MESIYPDQDAPILRGHNDRLELTLARWGFPPIPGQTAPITNIRNLKSRWWREVNREWLMVVTIAMIEKALPALVAARHLIAEFHAIVRKKAGDKLEGWLAMAAHSPVAPFANGLIKDIAAFAPPSPRRGPTARSKVKSPSSS
jgi:hypothetical protein